MSKPMFTDWDENKGSSGPAGFVFGSFDVGNAKRILKAYPREDHPLELAGYSALSKMIAGTNSSSQSINLEVPLICVQVGTGLLPIDGWGRIAEATARGLTSLPAVRLTSSEQQAIRLGGITRAQLRPLLSKNGIGDKEDAVIGLLAGMGIFVKDA
jgi:hypothetical protein